MSTYGSYNPQDPYGYNQYMAYLQSQQQQYNNNGYNQQYNNQNNQNHQYQQQNSQYQQQNIQSPAQKIFRTMYVLSRKEAEGQIVPLNENWLFLCANDNAIYLKFIDEKGIGKIEDYLLQDTKTEQATQPNTTQMFNYIANQIDALKGMLGYEPEREPEPEPIEQPKPKSRANKSTTNTPTSSADA